MRTRLLVPALAVVAVGALAFGTAVPHGPAVTARAAAQCPAGTVPERDVALAAFASGATRACLPALKVEPTAEVMAMGQQLAVRQNGGHQVAAGALEAAVAEHQALVAANAAVKAPAWTPVGVGPLNADVPGFTSTNALGLHQLAGRIEDFAYDPANGKTFYAAVANGGIWRTTDAGTSWHSIGDSLPTQITGAVELLRKGTATTLLAGTGDPAFGGSSFSGLGVYWSTGNGRWTKSKGVPAGSLLFNFDHDAAKPDTVYAATSKGLYRSTDAGRSFVNVQLPTTCTNVADPVCYFANMVTDVLVRPVGHGNSGGAVLAAVGWRAGQKPNKVGKPQSPRNGLYYSDNGTPGSFRYESNAAGFAADNLVGRVALGGATGSSQDHGYVYALVQDAQKFNHGANAFDIPDATGKTPNNTLLNGLYGSKDFGRTWTKLADAQQLQIPGSGTALSGANAATYAPGIQSWYNEWVQVDPTVQDEAGVPGRIGFGLEEVWTGAGAIPAAPDTGQYHVVGRYFSGASCAGLNLGGLEGSQDGPCPFTTGDLSNQGSTTHPDQHAGAFIPDTDGGVTLLAGNDGGAYKQKVARGAQLTNRGWGNGINNGFNTLLPYDAAMSTDGTVVQGLQDNGSVTTHPTTGKQTMAYGGDGFFVAIDPDNPNVWYEEYVGGAMHRTTNGGKSWTSINPGLSSPLFATPFVMDATSAQHIVLGGREIAETLRAKTVEEANQPDINTPDPTLVEPWVKVFDLGTAQHPGSATAGRIGTTGRADPSSTEIPNSLSAVDTRGNNTYVGYCGFCDIVTGGTPFQSGIATNVGGSKAGKAGTGNGWHIAAARGLPERYVNSVRMDPANPRTVYVTLGGYARRWIPPGSLGDDVSKVGKGHVFKSTDAGETFKDISGNLPDIGADDAFPFNGRLVVANDLGTYIGPLNGGTYQVLGTGLPAAPVFRLNRSPRNPRELIAASYGRGVYRITLPAGYAGQPSKVVSVFAPAPTTPSAAPRGSLAATGLPWVPVGLGAGLLLVGVLLRRRLGRS